jgi:hypothetical protein
MQKTTKLLLGLATLWPFAYLVLFFVVIVATTVFGPGSPEQPGPPPLIALILPLHFLTMLWVVVLMVIYIVNVFKNDRVDKDKKVLWAIVLFMGSMIAMPVYWYLYIWKSTPVSTVSAPEQLNSSDGSVWRHDVKGKRAEEAFVPPREPPDWRA